MSQMNLGIACDAYAEGREEIADLLDDAAPMADACNLWIEGHPAHELFKQVADWLRARIREEQ